MPITIWIILDFKIKKLLRRNQSSLNLVHLETPTVITGDSSLKQEISQAKLVKKLVKRTSIS